MKDSKNNVFNRLNFEWGLAGIALASPLFFLSALSPEFDYGTNHMDRPIIAGVSLMVAAGIVYLFVAHRFRDASFSRGLLVWVFLLGLLARIAMFTSTPILENDHYRYQWDGAVLANGFNPWRYSPYEIMHDSSLPVPAKLRELAVDSGPVVQRVGYPSVRTIYPLVTEASFALAHMLSPWSITAWRFILLVADLVSLYLLFVILRRLNLSLFGLFIYWWNPLLIKEIYNSGHMEVIIFPFILGALLLSIQRKYLLASGILGLAVGIKFWPVILLPVLLRPALRDPKRLVAGAILFASVSGCMFLPQYLTGLDSSAGLVAYGREWEMNDSLFMLILWVIQWILKVSGAYAGDAQGAARVFVTCLLLIWIIRVMRKDVRDVSEMSHRSLLVITALFLMSPTQFPWYYLWMLPLLAIHPKRSLLLLTVLLPLYYMRFYFSARLMVDIHDHGIVWLEFVPVWCLLIWEWYRGAAGEGGKLRLRFYMRMILRKAKKNPCYASHRFLLW